MSDPHEPSSFQLLRGAGPSPFTTEERRLWEAYQALERETSAARRGITERIRAVVAWPTERRVQLLQIAMRDEEKLFAEQEKAFAAWMAHAL